MLTRIEWDRTPRVCHRGCHRPNLSPNPSPSQAASVVDLRLIFVRRKPLARFFAKGLRAEIKDLGGDQLDLLLLPVQAS